MTASRDIAARLLEPHTLDIRNIVEVRAILDLVTVERAEAAAEIASLRLKVEKLERERDEVVARALAKADFEAERAGDIENEMDALEDQNRALEAATIEKCAKVAETCKWSDFRELSEPEKWVDTGDGFEVKRGAIYSIKPGKAIAAALRALASIPGEA